MQAELQKATRNDVLWDHGIVYYDFDESVLPSLQTIIRGAIDEYVQKTCLKFRLRSPTSTITSYIHFENISAPACTSSSIGKATTYVQTINVPGGCGTHETVLHEIGHAIGFWHEQSRPDRNIYLTIDWKNVEEDRKSLFGLRHEVDYQGEKYDYASVMHYNLWAFSSNGEPTLIVNNDARYRAQGSPAIGEYTHLSAGDVRMVDKLYKCYNKYGYWGRLRVDVIKATGPPIITIETLHAEITAYDRYGNSQIHATRNVPYTGAGNSWNKVFTTSYRAGWRYFEIRIKNRRGEVVLDRQTIWVEYRSRFIPVSDSYCSEEDKCVYFTYQMVE